MQTTQQTTRAYSTDTLGERSERHEGTKTLIGTYGVAALAGLAVLILSILALVGISPLWLTSIAVIAAGVAFLVEGAGIAARARQMQRSIGGSQMETSFVGGGISIQLLAGAAGITLGILALVGIAAPILLIGSAVIVYGVALLLGTLGTYGTSRMHAGGGHEGELTVQTIQASSGARVLVGIASVALGVLAVIGVGPALVLSQIAILTVGAILLLSGSAIGARLGMTEA
jgi:hypothetical protein